LAKPAPAPRWFPSAPPFQARRRVGLFGGSFNPAHEGHLVVARAALERLGLDEVWWLVSPQNPLKTKGGMAPLAERFAGAVALARRPGMRVTDIESALGTAYTAETIRRLRARYRRHAFVWLMGADNLAQIPAWKGWKTIFAAVPVAIFARPQYHAPAVFGAASRRFGRGRLPEREARLLARKAPPAWVFVHSRLVPASATAIRARRQRAAPG
jgi:nicotinate-nucleotide adenylyltransferase